jgi:hypothetical protein
MTGNGVRRLAAGLVAAGLACGSADRAAGQTVSQPDLLKQAEQARKLAEATAEAEVADAIKTANGLAKTFPDKAVRDLNAAVLRLDVSSGLGSAKREELVTRLKAASAAIQAGGKPAGPIDPKVLARIREGAKQREAAEAEAKAVQAAIADIETDVDAKRDADARRKVAALARQYPDNGAVIALQTRQGTADSLAVAKDISKRSAEAFVRTLNDVQASAIPIAGDIEFPKDWKEKMKLRDRLNAPQLTAEEEKLVRALETPIKNGLKDAPFEEAIQVMSTAIDQKLYLDKRSLEDLGVDLRKPVEVPGGVTARTALRVMLQQCQLTFLIRDNIIQVVSLEKAKEMMVTRAYDVRDVVSGGGLFNNPLQWGPYLDAQQTMLNGQMIVEAIQKSIDPKVWRDTAGGPATVLFHYGTMSIIVRAPSDVHADLHKKLYGRKK